MGNSGGEATGPLTPAVTDDGVKAKMQLVVVILQILGVFGVAGYCAFASVVDPVSVGFFCNDDSIRFPLLPQTVPALEASMIVILIPTVLIILVDTTTWVMYGERFGRYVNLVFCRPSSILALYYQSLGGFVFAMLSCYAITFTAKISVGRLRPHFLSVCQPDWKDITCSDASGFLYVDNFVCLGTDKAAIKEARVSFPSSHSSSSMCAMLYLVLYLQSRLVWLSRSGVKPSPVASKFTETLWGIIKLLCPFVQLVAFGGAFFIGMSRIKDKFHHPSDVITGFAIGATTAVFTFFYIAGLGSYSKGSAKEGQEEELEEDV
ncbi:PAP2 superfamily protein [Besnoitia besnoiti]|uniref:PAP2 superfamily protein n=1 Tax=Besnoitia besnoiti TaxID=94643 RepID=A0A2A9MQE3_BESBE|nr:PAP2 superfamily protein [Besnoitia besnoiti]PFH38240.1 PAP2 superfamily protein [Besnoitia besnoiti]